jgi:uncharacterized protein YecT (DUF1311 family)
MIGRTIGFLALALAVSAPAGAADEGKYSKAFRTCMDKSNGVTVAMRDCYGEEQARQDKLLNAAYKQVLAGAGGKEKTALVRAERAWMAFRDAQCDYQAAPEQGGTNWFLLIDSCHLEMTALRAKEFGDKVNPPPVRRK